MTYDKYKQKNKKTDEGRVIKGGVNSKPDTEKPDFNPLPQGKKS